ncbi:uncharacterized protein PGRI_092420 [Penicillium griseofulvum]|uniref:Uncharacterized protein n=1 Tax=Penicillium patulum TaxID=5078 RepID=A0A135LSE2_PENPA|nr:uncharacterized protein PGRI_092420 [Penicillium griseofulvum]KXG51849.1 hypothetical protein PGRI_092420 [Penicillium griseofulvum]
MQPALGILGDMYDLCAILKWAGMFWSPRELLYWNSSFRLTICEASKELCLKFEDAESSHRQSHKLSAINWEDPSEEQNADIDNYRRFLADRRDAIDFFTIPLTCTTDRQDWAIYNPERLFRLWRGDAGFLEWSEAKTGFLHHILRKSISIYGDEGSKTGRERQVSIVDSFPVIVD